MPPPLQRLQLRPRPLLQAWRALRAAAAPAAAALAGSRSTAQATRTTAVQSLMPPLLVVAAETCLGPAVVAMAAAQGACSWTAERLPAACSWTAERLPAACIAPHDHQPAGDRCLVDSALACDWRSCAAVPLACLHTVAGTRHGCAARLPTAHPPSATAPLTDCIPSRLYSRLGSGSTLSETSRATVCAGVLAWEPSVTDGCYGCLCWVFHNSCCGQKQRTCLWHAVSMPARLTCLSCPHAHLLLAAIGWPFQGSTLGCMRAAACA